MSAEKEMIRPASSSTTPTTETTTNHEEKKAVPDNNNAGTPISQDDNNEDTSSSSAIEMEDGIFVFSSLESIDQLVGQIKHDQLQQEEEEATDADFELLCLLLLWRPSCVHCHAMVEKVEEAHRLLSHHFSTTSDMIQNKRPPLFAKLNVEGVDKESLARLDVNAVPHLCFIFSNNKSTFLLDYNGRKNTAEDIFQTTLQYFYRLVVTSEEVRYSQESIDVYPRYFPNMQAVQDFVKSHKEFFFHYPAPEPALSPTMTSEEQDYVKWILQEERDANGSLASDDFVLLVQCRHSQDQPNALYESFDRMSQVLATRRDRLFVVNTGCDLKHVADGYVEAWKIPSDVQLKKSNWSTALPRCTFPFAVEGTKKEAERLVEFMIKLSTPSVLWFDRQATAPIAFPLFRKVHAVLFIDLHMIPNTPNEPENDPKSLSTRNFVRHFRQVCRQFRRGKPGVDTACMEKDMVCLVVPSTETRVLTTLGVDMWTPLDEAAPEQLVDPVLPTVLITDQRKGGTRRYYLEADDILASLTSMDDFFTKFWANALKPRIKSRADQPRTTESGVRILTASSIQQELLEKRDNTSKEHALILFSAPTCGHCKRFSVVWQQLAELLNHIEWSSFIKLYQIDVTTEEIVGLNITVRWVPDLYYLEPNKQRLVRFNETDDLGDDAGRINSPMEILSWLLTEGDFEDEQLRKLLRNLEKKF